MDLQMNFATLATPFETSDHMIDSVIMDYVTAR